MINPREWEFRQIKEDSADDFDVLCRGSKIGTFFWNISPNGKFKTATVRNLFGEIFVCSKEDDAVRWLAKSHNAAVAAETIPA